MLANLDTFMGAYRVLGSAQSNGPTLNASISTTVQDRMKRTSFLERGHRDTSKYTPFGEMGVDREGRWARGGHYNINYLKN